MSAYCNYYSQNCNYNCCDVYGYCPAYSSNCYFYYYNNDSAAVLTTGAIIGLVVGIVCLIGLIVLVVFLCRRCRQRNQPDYSAPQPSGTEVIVMNPAQQMQPYPYGQPQGGPGNLQNPQNPQGNQNNSYSCSPQQIPNGQVY